MSEYKLMQPLQRVYRILEILGARTDSTSKVRVRLMLGMRAETPEGETGLACRHAKVITEQ